jgi:hypothetical protein
MYAIIVILFSFLFSAQAFANAGSVTAKNLTITPIIGYEYIKRNEPTPSTKQRFIYGARFTYGPQYLAADFEFTRGEDSDSIPESNYTRKEVVNNIMLGATSKFNLSSFLTLNLRAGGHTRKSNITQTSNGVTTKTSPKLRISPYLGGGFELRLLNQLTLSANATTVFTGKPESSDRENRYSIGLIIGY